MNFSKWLINEGRNPGYYRGPVGGAFGKTGPKPQQKGAREVGNYTHTRDQQSTLQNYDQRVAFGRTQEEKIVNAAKKNCGMEILPATANQDKYSKIDGWWNKNGRRVPVQIKYRDSGDDLLFEVIKPFHSVPLLGKFNTLGRDVKPPGRPANEFNTDMITGAQYLLHLNQTGSVITVVELKPCYEIIYNMLKRVDDYGWTNPERQSLVTSRGVMRVQTDGASGIKKVMAYIPVGVVRPVNQCNVEIKIE